MATFFVFYILFYAAIGAPVRSANYI